MDITGKAKGFLDSLTEDPRVDGMVAEFTSQLLRFGAWFTSKLGS